MSADLIRYDLLVQDALRGVVRKVLADAARDGLPGEHHFSITFRTHAPGVRLSSRMREQYPDEMTIILQHQFWDLSVTDNAFEVGLSFRNVPEMLRVPFESLTGFFDASVQFALKFELEEEVAEAGANDAGPPPSALGRPPETLKQPHDTPERRKTDNPKSLEPLPATSPPAASEKDTSDPADKVVSIDAFRKKT
jgi:hypothetical protein